MTTDKTLKRFFALVMLATSLAIATPVLIVETGCTTSQKTLVYNTLAAVELTVDTAMKAYADRVVAGKVDAATQVKVRDAYSRYQASFGAAVAAAQLNLAKPASNEVQILASSLVTIINQAIGAKP